MTSRSPQHPALPQLDRPDHSFRGVTGATLVCRHCGGGRTDDPGCSRCRRCGGCLSVACVRSPENVEPLAPGVWRFAGCLPPVTPEHRITLCEGLTPLLELPRQAPGLEELEGSVAYVKDETRNPTGTFKDRMLAVAASVASQIGARGLVCASTGNAAASTAAYAARAGLRALVVVPASTAVAKLAQSIVCGATVVRVPGTYSDAYQVAQELAAAGFLNTTTTFASPYSTEGARTAAYELASDLPQSPDWVVVPIGAGPLLVGMAEGFADLVAAGQQQAVPRFLAVQAEGCAPIVRAFRRQSEHVSAWEVPETIVGSIADPLTGYEREGDITLAAIRATDGAAVAVSDGHAAAWVRHLAGATGLFAELGSAVAFAGAAQALRTGVIGEGESLVLCLTGTGLKEPLATIADLEADLVDYGSSAFSRLVESAGDER